MATPTPLADYPLVLAPQLVPRPWGGDRLGEGIGEAWDLSVHAGAPCRIENGPLKGRHLADVVAESPDDFGGPIRLLAKRLDCADNLSVQVHPRTGDAKTEAWVVLQAQPGAGVYHSFAQPVTPDQVRAAAADGTLPHLMRFLDVHAGQCVFVPAGTVHAIGAGLFLFELQQSANTTYRLHDWDRDRQLHIEEGLACCDLTSTDALPAPRPAADGSLRLVECEHFHADRVDTHKAYPLDPGGAWTAVFLVAGSARVDGVRLSPGQTMLLPAAAGVRYLEPDGTCTALVYGP